MADTPLTILRRALETIEAGRPAGSVESIHARDGDWKTYVREMQRVARVALREAMQAEQATASAGKPPGGISA